MSVKLLAFAQAADVLGFRERGIDCEPEETPRAILARLAPALDPATLRVAVDCVYADWDAPVGTAAEIALIPPVSGG
ncbi:MAG: MoaD/ThiS family protein [Chthoniobacter sp.]|nr:MoaD/ThiS family protein [Chthoniobacter sp.]